MLRCSLGHMGTTHSTSVRMGIRNGTITASNKYIRTIGDIPPTRLDSTQTRAACAKINDRKLMLAACEGTIGKLGIVVMLNREAAVVERKRLERAVYAKCARRDADCRYDSHVDKSGGLASAELSKHDGTLRPSSCFRV